ncbi:hypothetical protein SDC9_96953 [bioreactor metagenome]|uniref:Uncharacterized protein n=1 Tax=bioreactor metagenome TaxID=1076179 RepID=A0A645AB29_9ZZZZ
MKIPQDREKLIKSLSAFESCVKYNCEPFYQRWMLIARTRRVLRALKTRKDDACTVAMKEFVSRLGDILDSASSERLRFEAAGLLKKIYADCMYGSVAEKISSFCGKQMVRASIHEDSGHTDETTVTDETAYNGWFCDGGYVDHTDIHSDIPSRDEVRFEL